MAYNFLSPRIFAHRGASRVAPENTLAAFSKAVEQGADGLELDLKLSKDRKIVVIHDPKVDRTTNGKGWVHKKSYLELRSLDAGSWYAAEFSGEQIPTLGEVLMLAGSRLLFNIELANYCTPWDNLVDLAVSVVRDHELEKQVVFSSFLPGNLKQVRKLLPGVPTGLITMKGVAGRIIRFFYSSPSGTIREVGAQKMMIHPHFSSVNARLIAHFHSFGQAVNPWTVNDESEILRMFSLGVDGIITDNPGLAVNLRTRHLAG